MLWDSGSWLNLLFCFFLFNRASSNTALIWEGEYHFIAAGGMNFEGLLLTDSGSLLCLCYYHSGWKEQGCLVVIPLVTPFTAQCGRMLVTAGWWWKHWFSTGTPLTPPQWGKEEGPLVITKWAWSPGFPCSIHWYFVRQRGLVTTQQEWKFCLPTCPSLHLAFVSMVLRFFFFQWCLVGVEWLWSKTLYLARLPYSWSFAWESRLFRRFLF